MFVSFDINMVTNMYSEGSNSSPCGHYEKTYRENKKKNEHSTHKKQQKNLFS